nr:hypothetical protein [Tanacetum cinerariifolium]
DEVNSNLFGKIQLYTLRRKATNLIPNELFQKLLKDLKELAEYDQSTNTDRLIFLNDNHPENSSEENVVSKTNQELPQESDIHQLIEECNVEVPEQQKQKMEDTMFDLVKICHHKQFLCIHDDVNNLIESALDSKLISINFINSQRLDKKEQEVKNVEEQQAERRNRAEKSLQNFRSLMLRTFYQSQVNASDDESLPDEDVPAEDFKIYLNPLCDEDEINSDKLNPHCFNIFLKSRNSVQGQYEVQKVQKFSTRSHMTTRHKGKEIANPITPPSETASEEDSDPKQAQRDK